MLCYLAACLAVLVWLTHQKTALLVPRGMGDGTLFPTQAIGRYNTSGTNNLFCLPVPIRGTAGYAIVGGQLVVTNNNCMRGMLMHGEWVALESRRVRTSMSSHLTLSAGSIFLPSLRSGGQPQAHIKHSS